MINPLITSKENLLKLLFENKGDNPTIEKMLKSNIERFDEKLITYINQLHDRLDNISNRHDMIPIIEEIKACNKALERGRALYKKVL